LLCVLAAAGTAMSESKTAAKRLCQSPLAVRFDMGIAQAAGMMQHKARRKLQGGLM
jgi:hypothetical protein